jgi:phage I-like protein
METGGTQSSRRGSLMALSNVFVDLLAGMATDQPLPSEFRIFTSGVVHTEHGDFLFDDKAAASVMEAYQRQGVDYPIDYDHHTLATERGVKAVAAGWFTPELRLGELWASNVRWTPVAEAHLRAREYRYFSPLFNHTKDGRITKLINNALSNTPALHGIDALMAASTNNTSKEDEMSDELKTALARNAELERQNGTLTAELAVLKGQSQTVVTALSSTVGLQPTASPDDVRTVVAGLVGTRDKLLQLTAASSLAAAMGTVESWKSEAADAARLKNQIEEQRVAALSSELKEVLDKAGTDGKIPPAERGEYERAALAFGGNKPSRDGIDWLKGRVSAMSVLAPGGGAGGGSINQPGGAVALSESQKKIASHLGTNPAEVAKYIADQRAAGRQV